MVDVVVVVKVYTDFQENLPYVHYFLKKTGNIILNITVKLIEHKTRNITIFGSM